ncbi:hypothetical protein [Streptomyces virginiae]|uniref:hypothetical protein n=1 Tax=Streptomyces virginiae TaxID=1961 RepID=UPI00344E421C
MNVHNSSAPISRRGVGSASHTWSGERPFNGPGWWEVFHQATQSNRRAVKSSKSKSTSSFGPVRRRPGRG